MPKVRLGELFCGAGGMALGASLASKGAWSYKHVWATDISKDACKTIEQVVSPESVIPKDVQELDFGSLSPIDGLVFGFPCNDYSVVGERNGTNGKFGQLYLYGVRGLEELNPEFFVAENVSGIANTNRSEDFRKIIDDFENAGMGYTVSPRLYKFEEWGVPQKRHRYIIVGVRRDLGITFQHPEPDRTKPQMTSREALERTPIPQGAPNHEPSMPNQTVQDRLRYIMPGENAFTADIPEHLQLNMRSNALISQIYRRLQPDEPAYTVTGSGGGGTHLYHWEENRGLSNRERARLQTFSDDYVFFGKKESVRKQIGMAVPPEGAKVVFQEILEHISSQREQRRCSTKTSTSEY